MRIGIVGKGGAGKTTASALLSQYGAAKGMRVLAIDADINQHLAAALGVSSEENRRLSSLADELEWLKEHVRGQNPRIADSREIIKTTPPGRGSRSITLASNDLFLQRCTKTVGSLRLLVAGAFDPADVGTRCYHGKVGGVELFLNHLLDEDRDLVTVDMTAGADTFASGIFTRFDLLLVICEPTKRSLAVFDQFITYSRHFGINLKVVANKVQSDEEAQYVHSVVGEALISTLRYSPHLRSCEAEGGTPIDGLEGENFHALQAILEVASKVRRDWRKYYEQAVHFHLENARSWGNAAIGKDLTTQIDPALLTTDPKQILSVAQ